MAGLNCEVKWETRLCKVKGELGYFHDEQNAMLCEMAKHDEEMSKTP